MTNDEYDEYPATVRVPKGANLSRSRKSPGAHRGLTRNSDNELGHAEIFLKDENENEAGSSPASSSTFDTEEYAPGHPERDHSEAAELLVTVLLIGAFTAAPHLKRWWHSQALPSLKSRWNRHARSREANNQTGPTELATLIEDAPAKASPEVIDAPDQRRATMGSAEARKRLIAALMARRFSDEQIRLLHDSRIEDLELQSAEEDLTPEQVEDTISFMLETNPSWVDDLEKLLGRDRLEDVRLQLGEGHRPTDSEP